MEDSQHAQPFGGKRILRCRERSRSEERASRVGIHRNGQPFAREVIQLAEAKLGSGDLSTGQEDAEADNGTPILVKGGSSCVHRSLHWMKALVISIWVLDITEEEVRASTSESRRGECHGTAEAGLPCV
ncbi:hypothetical protein BHM03_00047523, partial [Ensete ventricosum]